MVNALLYLLFLSMGGVAISMVLFLITLIVYSIQDWRGK